MSLNENNDASQNNAAAAVAPETEQQKSGSAGEGCPNCSSTESWGHSSWCPRCGWYPAINACVEVDPIEETDSNEKPPEWYEIVPLWVWALAGGDVVLFVLSIYLRVTTNLETGERGNWALTQIAIGFIAFAIGHVWAYVYAVTKSADYGPGDIFMQPIGLWRPTRAALPQSFPRVGLAVWGGTAMAFGVILIGGIDYNMFFEDWGFEEQAQQNIVQEIVKKAKQAEESDEPIEDAITDFTGDEEAEAEAKELIQMDCLIIGYVGENPDEFKGLVLASLIKGRLQYVGTLFGDIPEEDRKSLVERMKTLHRDRPFVNAKVAAKWLQPVLMCRVRAEDLSKKNLLSRPVFKERLADAQ